MKKLLLLTIAITSVMAHAMDPVDASGSFGQENQQAPIVFIEIPFVISAQTELGKISRMQKPGITIYGHEKITVEFNRTEQRFYGKRHDVDHLNCQPMENQTEVETLFNQYNDAFNAAPQASKTLSCPIQ